MPNVTINLAYLMGSPVAGAYVKAQLITPDVLTDTIVQKRHLVDGYTDESGSLVLSLVANEGAPVYSYYRVRAWHPLTRQKVLDIAAFIPSTDCGLHETRYLRYPPNVDLRTLPTDDVPEQPPFPTEDTEYVFLPISLFTSFDSVKWEVFGPYTFGRMFRITEGGAELLPGTGADGDLWVLSSEIDGFDPLTDTSNPPSTATSWVPGMTETVAASIAGGVVNAWLTEPSGDEETDIVHSESVVASIFGPNKFKGAVITNIHRADQDGEVCDVSAPETVVVREMAHFTVTNGAGDTFDCHPSFCGSSASEWDIACVGIKTAGNIICRAYPL